MRQYRGLITGLFIAAMMVSPLGVQRVHAASAHRPSAACRFKHAVWGVVQDTSFDISEAPGMPASYISNQNSSMNEAYTRAQKTSRRLLSAGAGEKALQCWLMSTA